VSSIPAEILTTSAKFWALRDGMFLELTDTMLVRRRDRKVAWKVFIVVVIIGSV